MPFHRGDGGMWIALVGRGGSVVILPVLIRNHTIMEMHFVTDDGEMDEPAMPEGEGEASEETATEEAEGEGATEEGAM